jgi:hypothetical protein
MRLNDLRGAAKAAPPMIHVHYSGRLGNNLLQFAVGFALARLSGTDLNACPISGFPGTNRFAVAPLLPLGAAPQMPEHSKASHPTLSAFVEASKKADFIVRGWPFRASYFAQFADELRAILTPEPGAFIPSSERDIVVHLRHGDYFSPSYRDRFGYVLQPFLELLARLDYDRCLLVTDSARELSYIASEIRNATLISSTPLEDFRTIYHAHTVVLSPSTFGWCAQWLGYVPQVFLPSEIGAWNSLNHFALDDVSDSRISRFP